MTSHSALLDENEIEPKEMERLIVLNKHEEEARSKGFKVIAGIDEAGRGPLAGPVVAAACIIPKGVYLPKINDSKQLTAAVRERLFNIITKNKKIIFGIGIVDSTEIDRINILQATIQAMLMAIEQLDVEPDCLLVDGMALPSSSIPSVKIVQGDALSQSIAAASVLAKVTRDRLMNEFHEKWPHYGFDKNKGYGTSKHLEALDIHGACEIHRFSFEPIKSKNQAIIS